MLVSTVASGDRGSSVKVVRISTCVQSATKRANSANLITSFADWIPILIYGDQVYVMDATLIVLLESETDVLFALITIWFVWLNSVPALLCAVSRRQFGWLLLSSSSSILDHVST